MDSNPFALADFLPMVLCFCFGAILGWAVGATGYGPHDPAPPERE